MPVPSSSARIASSKLLTATNKIDRILLLQYFFFHLFHSFSVLSVSVKTLTNLTDFSMLLSKYPIILLILFEQRSFLKVVQIDRQVTNETVLQVFGASNAYKQRPWESS